MIHTLLGRIHAHCTHIFYINEFFSLLACLYNVIWSEVHRQIILQKLIWWLIERETVIVNGKCCNEVRKKQSIKYTRTLWQEMWQSRRYTNATHTHTHGERWLLMPNSQSADFDSWFRIWYGRDRAGERKRRADTGSASKFSINSFSILITCIYCVGLCCRSRHARHTVQFLPL